MGTFVKQNYHYSPCMLLLHEISEAMRTNDQSTILSMLSTIVLAHVEDNGPLTSAREVSDYFLRRVETARR